MRSPVRFYPSVPLLLVAVFSALSFPFGELRAQRRADLPAEKSRVDTSYGRLDGDVTVVVGTGGSFGDVGPLAHAQTMVRYLDLGGFIARYDDAVGAGERALRRLSLGLELRPVFWARWVNGWHAGRAPLDLVLDSLGIDISLYSDLTSPNTSKMGLSTGLSLEVPLFGKSTGLWLRATARGTFDTRNMEVGGPMQRSVELSLSWHQVVHTGLVDLGDRRLR